MPDDEKTGCPQWFALAVKPRFERAVAKTLESRSYESFLPLYRKQHPYRARLQDAELPLFPGYVCCRFDIRQRLPILTTPGVIQVLGAANIPSALPDHEIASLQTAVRTNVPIQPFPYMQAGNRVRIERGSLAGMEGIVLSFKQTLRLVLSITLLQKSVLLEIERDQIGESELSCIASSSSLLGD